DLTRDQCSPPSVDLYNPSPASESLEPFGSPVPTYTVAPLGSVGSYRRDPIELVANPALTGRHCGVPASTFAVFHTPPPAAPTSAVQEFPPQRLDTAKLVTRPDTTEGAPVYVTGPGTLPTVGPIAFQAPPEPNPAAAIPSNAAAADNL